MQTHATVNTTLPANPARKQKKWIKEAAAGGARYHHDTHIPLHFKAGAASRYGYSRRSKSHQRRKQRGGFSSLPLVMTGRLRAEITSMRQVKATSTRGAKLIMQASSIAGVQSGRFRFRKGQTSLSQSQQQVLRIHSEIQAITNNEIRDIAAKEGDIYTDFANQPGPRRKLAAV